MTSEILGRTARLDLPPELIDWALTGTLVVARGEVRTVPGFLEFHAGAATFPWRSQAAWIAAQLAARTHLERAAAMRSAAAVFGPDIYRRHLREAGAALSGASAKVEGTIDEPTPAASESGRLFPVPHTFSLAASLTSKRRSAAKFGSAAPFLSRLQQKLRVAGPAARRGLDRPGRGMHCPTRQGQRRHAFQIAPTPVLPREQRRSTLRQRAEPVAAAFSARPPDHRGRSREDAQDAHPPLRPHRRRPGAGRPGNGADDRPRKGRAVHHLPVLLRRGPVPDADAAGGQIADGKPDGWYDEVARSVCRPEIYLEAARKLIDEEQADEADFPWDSDGLPAADPGSGHHRRHSLRRAGAPMRTSTACRLG
jgi:hypothetical protein